MARHLLKYALLFVVTSACVDPIDFDLPPAADLLIVDGSITDKVGPCIVRISRAVELDADTTHRSHVTGAIVKLHDYGIGVEEFSEVKPGEYRTRGALAGVVGHTYYITIELPDGTKLESEPETMMPAGEIVAITHQFEPRTTRKIFGIVNADAFNIFVDGNTPVLSSQGGQSFVRWRFTGTFKAVTHPELHQTWIQGEFYYKTPYPCSGFVVDPAIGGGKLTQREECTCCDCWAKQFETTPRLSDTELVSNGQFRNIKVGDVPITPATLIERYRVEVEQMTISRNAFDFFKLIRSQKEASTNLFQPAQGKLVGNIRSSNPDQVVVGLFWAAAVARKTAYLTPKDVPGGVSPVPITEPCNTYYANSTAIKPADWDD
ncbi:MAG TPA: DUF4249 domain-containing protein [Cyclobacteriaceae bacterium]|nr:DUF4249 domain-containing protein [Cyclobacteriaceae bacterium]